MRTITVNVFPLSELSEESKEAAHANFCATDHYPWFGEENDSLKAFCEHFGVTVYHLTEHRVGFSCELPEDEDMSGLRLRTWILNGFELMEGRFSCKGSVSRRSKVFFSPLCLTGYCADYSLLKPILDFVASPSKITFEGLIGECLENYQQDCRSSYEHYFSMESFEEMSEINEWEYHADGSLA